MAAGVNELSASSRHIRISVTPAFASRVIVPALPQFYSAHAETTLAIDATERLVDLRRGEADVAVRYGRGDHGSLDAWPLADDEYIPVAVPGLARGGLTAAALKRQRLLHFRWKNEQLGGPTWGRWMTAAGSPGFNESDCVNFSDEALVAQAALDGVGVALLSSVLVRGELVQGRLVQVHPLSLPGLRFSAVATPDHPERETIVEFVRWLKALMQGPQSL
ncbi:LysR substrate-binding domain-containing protein [Comamonadaceae bacterium BS-T2-15]|uniref:LysR substrate-binding domain-containing protein n=2 Tax=Scleromatobacter humisilvae TaxID=2897159 RepID=A0A9X2C144_9BURK|nr:LysR substrate-binding domain-containing protein [Scleromatobacter humisilvae]